MVASETKKRRYARAIYCTEADAVTKNGNFKCLTINLTPDGMLIKTREPLSIGEDIAVFINLSDPHEPTRIEGKVVRVMGDSYGLKFNTPVVSLLVT